MNAGEERPVGGACPNCGDPTQGAYCPSCGQRRIERRVALRHMLAEVLEDQLSLHSSLPRTLRSLFFHPGHLSREYMSGRIQRYIPPFRLYLASSVVFFLLLSFSMRDVEFGTGPASEDAAADTAATGTREARVGGLRVTVQDSVRAAIAADAALARMMRDSVRATAAADTTPSPYQWGEDFNVSTPIARLDTLISHRVDELRRMPANVAFKTFLGEVLARAPTAVFLMLPVFALLLKLLYIRRKRYYVEHFVFGLHTHAFVFLLFSVMLVGRTDWIRVPAFLWMVVYFFIAMKRFYGQGMIRTFVKYVLLFNAYMLVISIGIAGLLVGALLLG